MSKGPLRRALILLHTFAGADNPDRGFGEYGSVEPFQIRRTIVVLRRLRDGLTLKVSPAAVRQTVLPSGLDPSTVEGASSDGAMHSERGLTRATAPPVQSIFLCLEDLTSRGPSNTIPLMRNCCHSSQRLPHPQLYFFSLRQSHHDYQTELF